MRRAVNEATFTFRVDEALKQAFTEAAKQRDRSGAQLLRDFMRDVVRAQQDVVAYDAWFRREVQAGMASAQAGRLLPAAEVEARFAAKRAVLKAGPDGAE
jgi:predicted transcriptional regulator